MRPFTLRQKPPENNLESDMADDSHFRVFQTLRTAGDIVAAGLAAPESQPALEAVGQQYAIAITPQVAALIDSSDLADPIARQFIPDPRELVRLPAELDDPIGMIRIPQPQVSCTATPIACY